MKVVQNPAVEYRTRTEILRQSADKQPVLDWYASFQPDDWQTTKGLWYTYRLSAVAECGLTGNDVDIDTSRFLPLDFDGGCAGFMLLRSLVMLGFADLPQVAERLTNLGDIQLSDGGFLCGSRRVKIEQEPKSCVKSNNMALLFMGECAKRGLLKSLALEGVAARLVEYYRLHKMFYRTDGGGLMLDAREGWRNIDVFHPFETMRVGLHNIVEAMCALGYGNDSVMDESWNLLDAKACADGVLLDATMTRSWLPKEKAGTVSRWATFYTALARKQAGRE